MKFYKWHVKFIACDVFLVVNREEFIGMTEYFHQNTFVNHAATLTGDDFYIFINTEKKFLAPMTKLAYAFGGMWNAYPPYGDEIENFNIDFREYRQRFDKYLIAMARLERKARKKILRKRLCERVKKKWGK